MSKIICPCVECIYNGDDHVCYADEVKLTFRNMATVNEGRVDMWVCNQYELSEGAKAIDDKIIEYLRGKI